MSFWCFNRPKPPCCPESADSFYAQFTVTANPESGSDLPMSILFQEGDRILLNGPNQILLAPGYLYLVNYLFLATPEPDGYFEIIPRINGSLRLYYAFFAPAGSLERNASAAGSFTTNEAASQAASLSFNLTYPPTVNNIDITGTVSVTPLPRL